MEVNGVKRQFHAVCSHACLPDPKVSDFVVIARVCCPLILNTAIGEKIERPACFSAKTSANCWKMDHVRNFIMVLCGASVSSNPTNERLPLTHEDLLLELWVLQGRIEWHHLHVRSTLQEPPGGCTGHCLFSLAIQLLTSVAPVTDTVAENHRLSR